jgi:hypothetical protein
LSKIKKNKSGGAGKRSRGKELISKFYSVNFEMISLADGIFFFGNTNYQLP